MTVKNVLDKLGIKYWLTDGTLLGFYREGDFITGDNDVDIGVFIDELAPGLLDSLKKQGFGLLRENGTPDCGLEYTLTRKGANLDIFFFYKEANYVWHANWLGGKMIKFKYPIFALKKKSFLGQDFYTPGNIEGYIETKYGRNWKNPDKSWNWATDPKNIF